MDLYGLSSQWVLWTEGISWLIRALIFPQRLTFFSYQTDKRLKRQTEATISTTKNFRSLLRKISWHSTWKIQRKTCLLTAERKHSNHISSTNIETETDGFICVLHPAAFPPQQQHQEQSAKLNSIYSDWNINMHLISSYRRLQILGSHLRYRGSLRSQRSWLSALLPPEGGGQKVTTSIGHRPSQYIHTLFSRFWA